MSYYFPFGGSDATTVSYVSHSLSTITASMSTSNAITVITASYAVNSGSIPPAGFAGINITTDMCNTSASVTPSLLVSGATGGQGPIGSKGTDAVTCPDGTVRCAELEVSLSAQFLSGTGQRGVNYFASSGSQFNIVCMQIPTGCTPTQAQAGCAKYLTIGTPNIP